MYKLMRLMKRRKDFSPERFKEYWLTRRAPLERRALGMAPIRRIVANIATGEVALGGTVPPFDGMLALFCDTRADLDAVLAGPVPAMLQEDEANFVDADAKPVDMLADDVLVCQKSDAESRMKTSGQVKIIRTVFCRSDLTMAQFRDYWLKEHAKLEDRVIRETPMLRIVANFALPQASGKPPYDGMAELYFENVADIRATMGGPVPAMMRKDEENFVQMDAPAIRFIVEEHLIGEK